MSCPLGGKCPRSGQKGDKNHTKRFPPIDQIASDLPTSPLGGKPQIIIYRQKAPLNGAFLLYKPIQFIIVLVTYFAELSGDFALVGA